MAKNASNILPREVDRFLLTYSVSKQSRLLVGVSGGMDSMTLVSILYELGYSVSVSHVNFNLRGLESDEDEAFVRQWCAERSIPFFFLNKITKTVEAELGINTQTAARKIRYEWWAKLARKHGFEYVCTAHHFDDSVETLLLNLFRGTGIRGLRGIPPHRGIFLRPLLHISKADVKAYCLEHEITYREDSSNDKDDYQRNQIRHHIVPLLQEMYPGIQSSMHKTIDRINLELESIDQLYADWVKNNIHSESGGYRIEGHRQLVAFVLRWLEEAGIPWSLAADYVNASNEDSGQSLFYNARRLTRTAFGFYLENIKSPAQYIIDQPGLYQYEDFSISVEEFSVKEPMHFDHPNVVYVSDRAMSWPMTLRHIRDGDTFQPFGMNGKHKKIQDLLTDLKLEMYQKNKVLILENQEHILWVVGLRLDERARVLGDESTLYKITYSQHTD